MLSYEVNALSRKRRIRRERTHDGRHSQSSTLWSDKRCMSGCVVLSGGMAAGRVEETGMVNGLKREDETLERG